MMADEMERMSTSDIAAAGNRTEEQKNMEQRNTERPETVTSLGSGRAGARPEMTDNRSSMQGTTSKAEEEEVILLSEDFLNSHRQRWTEIQSKFVDDPRMAVQDADGLVAEVIHELATKFSDQSKKLESKWQSGGDVSTEDLRVSLRMYRAFFQRLMSA